MWNINRKKEALLPQKELLKIFRYYKGELYWKIKPSTAAWIGKKAGQLNNKNRFQVNYKGYIYYIHRIIWTMHEGAWPVLEIDHINGDGTDNRIENLREVNRTVQNKNAALRKDSTTRIVGVHWNMQSSKWRAQICFKSKQRHLGLYEDFFEACCARKSAERKYGFHVNHGRKR